MITEVTMPKLGLLMTEGEVVRWLVGNGQPVEQGKPIVHIMTKKINYQVIAPAGGILHHAAQANDRVLIGAPLAYIAPPGEPAPAISRTDAPAAQKAPANPTGPTPAVDAGGAPQRFVPASPAARRLAQQIGVDLSDVQGTGPDGSIVERDVLNFGEMRKAPPPAAVRTPEPTRLQARIIPLTGQRRAIAQRMVDSLHTMAQVTLNAEADVTHMTRLRKRSFADLELSNLDVILKAVAVALRAHPRLNATLLGDEIELLPDVHVGFAVQVDEGLLVPVVRDADRRTLAEIAAERRRLVEAARDGSLTVDDVTGSTFTVTDLGSYGIDFFTPIINPPEVAILGLGRVVQKPGIARDKVVNRLSMMLCLSFDHRVLDGAPAAAFLQTMTTLLAKPESLF
jgi:pyruvate dehydrogenase E2 component (dihydrolipoamide acetyltransferase)